MPVITLKGWWWKRFIPKYRRQREVMQALTEYTYKENKDKINKAILDNLIYGTPVSDFK